MNISRRDFLKACGASAAMLGIGAKFASPAALTPGAAVPITPHTGTAVLIDTTRCVGCNSCTTACKIANHLPTDPIPPTCLSATTLSVIELKNISPTLNKPVLKPVKWACMHCENPACVASCPVGALTKAADGHVAYDENICIGCRYCMAACPFGIPKYDWASPDPKIVKCTQACMADGTRNQPACVQACPNQALLFGNRTDILAIARDRITQSPSKYVNHIYGENELGGTSRLYISGTPFEELGFRTDLPSEPLPQYTWNAMEKIPAVLGSVAVLLSGIAWWTHRGESKKLVEAPVTVTNK